MHNVGYVLTDVELFRTNMLQEAWRTFISGNPPNGGRNLVYCSTMVIPWYKMVHRGTPPEYYHGIYRGTTIMVYCKKCAVTFVV